VSCITTSTLVLYCSATTFGPVGHVAVVGRRASVAERLERLERQIGGVHPQDAVVVRQSAVAGMSKDKLLIDAVNWMPLGPWHVWSARAHGFVPSPTVKKKARSTRLGMLAGYSGLARLSLALKLAAKVDGR
jgi:hypothetical protein